MKYKDKIIRNISDLIEKLKTDTAFYPGPIWFRGQSDKKHKLLPSYYRYSTTMSERTLMQKFRQNATLLLEGFQRTEFEWLFIMQHHGVPTRLLDWTESSLVALYFACCADSMNDGALWVLLPVELNTNAGIKPEETYNIPSIDDNALLNYKPNNFHGERNSEMFPLAAISARNTPRMQSQLGTFTIFHRNKIPIERIGDRKHIWRYIIPKKRKIEIINELKLCGINKFSLFPELQSIGEIIKEEL